MKHYAVVFCGVSGVEFFYDGREVFITTHKKSAEEVLQWCQDNLPENVEYQIVEFDVKEM